MRTSNQRRQTAVSSGSSKQTSTTAGTPFNNRYLRTPKLADVKSGKTSLRLGDRGAAVRVMQKKLGVKVDGFFGPITAKAMARSKGSSSSTASSSSGSGHSAKSSFDTKRSSGTNSSQATSNGTASASSSAAGTSLKEKLSNAGKAVTSLVGKAGQQAQALLNKAKAASEGRRPDGKCLYHVQNYLDSMGKGSYGNASSVARLPYAKDWGNTVNKNPAAYGLKKLNITNPYQAPAGAIVVVNPGTPGTRHPKAGDIAVADGKGTFYNGGKMGYGGSQNFPAGNSHVVGIYVPA